MTTQNSRKLPERKPLETMIVSQVEVQILNSASRLLNVNPNKSDEAGFYRVSEKIIDGQTIEVHEVVITYAKGSVTE